jgi:hypothetical protein
VLFAGSFGAPLGATFWFDGVDWTAASPAPSPSPRAGHAMVLDPARSRVVLFGGQQNNTYLGGIREGTLLFA